MTRGGRDGGMAGSWGTRAHGGTTEKTQTWALLTHHAQTSDSGALLKHKQKRSSDPIGVNPPLFGLFFHLFAGLIDANDSAKFDPELCAHA